MLEIFVESAIAIIVATPIATVLSVLILEWRQRRWEQLSAAERWVLQSLAHYSQRKKGDEKRQGTSQDHLLQYLGCEMMLTSHGARETLAKLEQLGEIRNTGAGTKYYVITEKGKETLRRGKRRRQLRNRDEKPGGSAAL